MVPYGQLEAVRVGYAAEELNRNEKAFARASPGFACDVALLCAKDDVLHDVEYGEHVERVVRDVTESKRLLHTRVADGRAVRPQLDISKC